MSKGVVAGLYGERVFSFIGNYQFIFQSGCTILHSYQQRMHDLVSLHPHHHLVVITIFYFGHSDWYVVISDHGFNMHFPNG